MALFSGFNLNKTLQYGARRLTRIVTQPIYLGYRKVAKALNPTGFMTRVMGDVRKGFRRLFTHKPTSLKDYFAVGNFYIAKKLAFILIVLALLLPALYISYVHPVLTSRFLTRTMVVNTAAQSGYTGKVRLLVSDGGPLLYRGRLQEGRVTSDTGELYQDGKLVYRGGFANERYDGQGTLYGPDGAVLYEGGFSDNRYSGQGRLYEWGELLYEGGFENGVYQGDGVEYYPGGGAKYRGGFVKGAYSGEGAMYTASGTLLYQGGFAKGKAEGAGVLYNNGEKESEGAFVGGKLTGKGVLYENGSVLYEGDLLDGKMHGKGKTYSGDRPIYEGEFAENTYSGSGRLYDAASRTLIYDGQFDGGKFSGAGRYFDPESGRLVYEGGFYDGVYDGQGTLYDPKTQAPVYAGGFHLGLFEGEGKLYDIVTGYPIYEGGFRAGRYEGSGVEYNSINGAVLYEGGYLMGKFSDGGILYDPDSGLVLEAGVFREGELVTPVTDGISPARMFDESVTAQEIAQKKQEALLLARHEPPAGVAATLERTYSGPSAPDGAADVGQLVGFTEEQLRSCFAAEPVEWPVAGRKILVYDDFAENLHLAFTMEGDRVVQADQWGFNQTTKVSTGMSRDETRKLLGTPEGTGEIQVDEAQMIVLGQSNRFHGRITNLSPGSRLEYDEYAAGERMVRMLFSGDGECLLVERRVKGVE